MKYLPGGKVCNLNDTSVAIAESAINQRQTIKSRRTMELANYNEIDDISHRPVDNRGNQIVDVTRITSVHNCWYPRCYNHVTSSVSGFFPRFATSNLGRLSVGIPRKRIVLVVRSFCAFTSSFCARMRLFHFLESDHLLTLNLDQISQVTGIRVV